MNQVPMRYTIALVLIAAWLAAGCSRTEKEKEDDAAPLLERAQEKLEESIAEGTDKARQALAAALERWEDLKPKAERALSSLEARLETLADDAKKLKHLPPEAVERIRARLAALREKLAEADDAHEQGHTDLAVEKAEDVEKESRAIEDLLVERPDAPPAESR